MLSDSHDHKTETLTAMYVIRFILHNERAVVMVVGFTTTFAINAYHH
jgi:hypothetical protein